MEENINLSVRNGYTRHEEGGYKRHEGISAITGGLHGAFSDESSEGQENSTSD